MAEQRKLHPNYEVNLRRFAAEERSNTLSSDRNYVVKFGNGGRKYFEKYSEARAFRDVLVKAGEYPEHVHIINIARQPVKVGKIKKQLSMNVGGKAYYGGSLTASELADMVLGRMGEATSHSFRSMYATMEMRVVAQRALRNMIRSGQGRITPNVREALELELHLPNERKGVRR